MKSVRLSLLVVAAALIVASCGNTGAPEEYDDTTQTNYIEGCQVALDEDPQAVPANEVCVCAYDEIVRTIPFDDFKELDDELRNNVDAISDSQTGQDVTMIVADCIRQIASS